MESTDKALGGIELDRAEALGLLESCQRQRRHDVPDGSFREMVLEDPPVVLRQISVAVEHQGVRLDERLGKT